MTLLGCSAMGGVQGDETQRAFDAPDDGATTVVPDVTETRAADPLAWSDTDVLDDVSLRSWRSTISRAAIVFTVLSGIAGVIAAVSLHRPADTPHAATPSSTTSAAKPPPKAELAMAPGLTMQDKEFINRLGAHNLWYSPEAQDDAVYNAHVICGVKSKTYEFTSDDLDAAADAMHRKLPGMAVDQAREFITVAINVYCPDPTR
jgi:hypothetical protein